GRCLVRAAFQRRNRSDAEDSFRFRSPEIVTEAGGIPGQFQTVDRMRGRGEMNTFPSEEALVAAYWRRLARSIDSASGGKRRKTSSLKSQVRLGVRRYFTASRNVTRQFQHGARVPHTCGTVDQPTSNQDRDDKRLIGREMLKRCKLVANRRTAG